MSLLLFGQRACRAPVSDRMAYGHTKYPCTLEWGEVQYTARDDDDYWLPKCLFAPQGKCGILCPPTKGYGCNYFCGVSTATAQQCD